jgi:hypothetical protein
MRARNYSPAHQVVADAGDSGWIVGKPEAMRKRREHKETDGG